MTSVVVPVEPTPEMWAAGEAAFDRDPDVHHETVVANIWEAMLAARPEVGEARDVREFVREYEFRGDAGDYTPTEDEQALIEDAIHGYLSEARLTRRPAPTVEEVANYIRTIDGENTMGAGELAARIHALWTGEKG